MSNDHLVKSLEKKLASWKPKAVEETYGEVLEVGDGIAKISGLSTVMASEMIEITAQDGTKVSGVVLNLEEQVIGAIILGDCGKIQEGDKVSSTKKILQVPVGEQVTGRGASDRRSRRERRGKAGRVKQTGDETCGLS